MSMLHRVWRTHRVSTEIKASFSQIKNLISNVVQVNSSLSSPSSLLLVQLILAQNTLKNTVVTLDGISLSDPIKPFQGLLHTLVLMRVQPKERMNYHGGTVKDHEYNNAYDSARHGNLS